MNKTGLLLLILGLFLIPRDSQSADPKKPTAINLDHADQLEVLFAPLQDTTFAIGNVIFHTETGTIYCDSAIWLKGKRIKLKGRVVVDDVSYRLASDSADYDLVTGEAVARGSYVELWSRPDSIFATGTQAFYNRDRKYFYMENRPTMFLRYPDSSAMVKVIADVIQFDGFTHVSQASGNVHITSKEIDATSGCAVMHATDNSLDLFDSPVAKRGQSVVSGNLICVSTENRLISRIDVLDSAKGEFKEPVDSAKNEFDQSTLKGHRIIFDFTHGLLTSVTSTGQAYSWYYPSTRGKDEKNENAVSGDTIQFAVKDERLQAVTVVGGAMGTYFNSKTKLKDSVLQTKTDTIGYSGQRITYNMRDSVITLLDHSHVTSGTMLLDAQKILFDTRENLVKAYSADVPKVDTTGRDSTLTSKLQPNTIPVVLKDKGEDLYGDYLEYSIKTEKGRIVQSKSKYETGFYYGEKVFRSTKSVYYVADGRYTTCDADEPHFHFYSKHMKMIEGDKLIAKPVVLSIGRLPILALPYYVFPLKKGRHSGILPFRFGNFERGDRYVENVGYYWAASDYWDWQNSMGYVEASRTLTYRSAVTYKKLYAFDGNFSFQTTRQTLYSNAVAREETGSRYVITAVHNQQVTPSFSISGNGQYQSDPRYFTDLSTNLNDRLNRQIKSSFQFRKTFSSTISLSGQVTHVEDLDLGSRSDVLPSLSLALPTIYPFGSGKLDENGISQPHWYNSLTVSYSPRFVNSWSRTKVSYLKDTVINGSDTSITASRPSWRAYYRLDQGVGINFPQTIAKYFTFNPNLSYSESWFRISPTDQSRAIGIYSSTNYRTYSASAGASLQTRIYGTVAPNVAGLTGLRQVLTPSLGYSFVPKTARHDAEAGYAGATAGSSVQSGYLNVSLGQLYQAKIKRGDDEKALDLITISSSATYNFRGDSLKWSNVSTSFQSNILPRIGLSGSMIHTLYKPGTAQLRPLSPSLLGFSINTSFQLAGTRFFFDDPGQPNKNKGEDTAVTLSASGGGTAAPPTSSSRWNMSVEYNYSESGRGVNFYKSAFLRLSLGFALTTTTNVAYSQSYNPVDGRTVYNSVTLTKNLHCWTGILTWVPTGSTRGWAFQLFVTAIPAIKVDNSQSTVSSSMFGSSSY
jgi:lipopolysaccharide assembly outer membrane protein LptD (OstA)